MSALVTWINSHEARIFKFKPTGVEVSKVEIHGPHHHAEVHGKNHTKSEGDIEKFYRQVITTLGAEKDAQWLILGPGLAHTHLKHIVDKDFPQLSKCIVAVEPMANATDGQIQDYARKFFKHRGVFEAL